MIYHWLGKHVSGNSHNIKYNLHIYDLKFRWLQFNCFFKGHVNNRSYFEEHACFRYILLHHMMGGTGWSYPEGGMGAVTQAMAAAAVSYGAHIFTNVVSSLLSFIHYYNCIFIDTSYHLW
jgi:hypothetical protein